MCPATSTARLGLCPQDAGHAPGRGPAPPRQAGREGTITVGIQDRLYAEGYYRPRYDRILGGVCSGLGRRWGLTPWATRWLFILVLIVVPGSPILIYPILWIVMPDERPAIWAPAPDPSQGSAQVG